MVNFSDGIYTMFDCDRIIFNLAVCFLFFSSVALGQKCFCDICIRLKDVDGSLLPKIQLLENKISSIDKCQLVPQVGYFKRVRVSEFILIIVLFILI